MRKRKAWILVLALGILCAAPATPASAQATLGTLRGTVLDEQGGALPGVAITVREVATNTVQTVVTSGGGQYFLPNLRPGSYELTTELTGFVPIKETLQLRVGQDLTVNLTMSLGRVSESIEVVGRSVSVETQSTLATVVGNEQMDALPTIGGEFSGLAILAPGTTSSQTTGTGQGTGVSISGQRPFTNGIVVDGASNQMAFYGRQSNDFPQDWIQEFQVLTNSFSAEFGQAAGGMLNVITRAGANRTAGRAYGFFRDAALDSPPFAGRFDADKNPIYLDETPPFSQQRYGGFLGGPIVKDRLFYFGGVERLVKDSSDVLGISDYWRQFVTEAVVPERERRLVGIAKVDWNASQKNHLYFRYTNSHKRWYNMAGTSPGRTGPTNPIENRSTFGGPLWNVLGNWTTTLSNAAFNEFRVYFGVDKPWILSNVAGQLGGRALLDAAGYNSTVGSPTGKFSDWRYPGITLGSVSFSGLEGESNFFIMDTFSFMKGSHQFKLGAVLTRQQMFMDVDSSHKGHWSFLADRVFDINDPLSYPNSFTGNIGSGEAYPVAWSPSFFVQDTWQPTSNLTLNLGVRYQVDGSLTAANPWVDAYNERIVARLGGEPPLQKSKLDLNNVAPRLGAVWVPTEDRKTTLRGSFGLYYDQNHWNVTDVYINETLLAFRKISISCTSPGTNPFWNAADRAGSIAACQGFLVQNFPGYPDLSALPFPLETMSYMAHDVQVPFAMNISVGATREIGNTMSLRADYVRTRTYQVSAGFDTNWVQNADGTYSRRDPRYGNMSVANNLGGIWYNGLVTRLEYRPSAAAWLGASYTLAKSTSNTTSGLTTGGNRNPFDINEDYGPDDNDRRHNLVVDASYMVPKIDVQVSGIAAYRSPLPWSVSTSFELDDDPFSDRPEPRGSRRGDSEKNVDLRLSKIVRFGDRYVGMIFWEMFNVFNTDNFLRYQGSLQSSQFELPITQAPKRRQQLGIRFDF